MNVYSLHEFKLGTRLTQVQVAPSFPSSFGPIDDVVGQPLDQVTQRNAALVELSVPVVDMSRLRAGSPARAAAIVCEPA